MDVMEAINNRRSVRSYSDKAIPQDILDQMCQAIRMAPSACNLQPWHFILVKDLTVRQQLAEASHKRIWMAQAPLIIVACGLPGKAYKGMGGHGNSVEVDVAIAMDHLTLAAVSQGLGTCWIGAFDEAPVKVLLGVPARVKVVAMTPLGYPASADLNHPLDQDLRKSTTEIFSLDCYQGPTE